MIATFVIKSFYLEITCGGVLASIEGYEIRNASGQISAPWLFFGKSRDYVYRLLQRVKIYFFCALTAMIDLREGSSRITYVLKEPSLSWGLHGSS